jgi:hypothetical protein
VDLRAWFETNLAKLPARGQTAESIRYALNHWDGLVRFLDDGHVDVDTNMVERSTRPVALSRKNALFAGSDDGGKNWAAAASLVETCKLNAVDPQRYLAELLTRLIIGWPQPRINDARTLVLASRQQRLSVKPRPAGPRHTAYGVGASGREHQAGVMAVARVPPRDKAGGKEMPNMWRIKARFRSPDRPARSNTNVRV